MLHKYQHHKRAQNSTHSWHKPTYGVAIQLTTAPDTTTPLETKDVKRIQQVVRTLLHYAQAVDATMLVALGTIAAQQTRATNHTAKLLSQLLDYCHIHPDATIGYHASDMISHIHSDASYKSEAKACSQNGRHFYLG